MKKKFLSSCLRLIKKYNPDYDDIKMDEIRYGLEGIYLSVTKLIIISIIALWLNIFKEMILLLLFFNILRSTGFGLHATKSWICLLSSTMVFIILPYVSKIMVIPTSIKIILILLAIILVFKYAPADTKKRPLINAEKRKKCKYKTVINTIILSILSLYIKDNTISNLIILGIYIEVILILPITYKIFKLSYNNYITYQLQMD